MDVKKQEKHERQKNTQIIEKFIIIKCLHLFNNIHYKVPSSKSLNKDLHYIVNKNYN